MRVCFILQLTCAAVIVQFSGGQAFAQSPLPPAPAAPATAASTPPVNFMDQGLQWSAAKRADCYSRDQGSKMIQLSWLKNLKQPNGAGFLADNLARYGYLTNPANTNNLPVGFTSSGPTGKPALPIPTPLTAARCRRAWKSTRSTARFFSAWWTR